MLDVSRTVTSLDKPVGDDEDTSLGALMGSGETSTEEEVEVSLSRQAVRKAVEELPDRERMIIKLRFGLDGEEREPLPLAAAPARARHGSRGAARDRAPRAPAPLAAPRARGSERSGVGRAALSSRRGQMSQRGLTAR